MKRHCLSSGCFGAAMLVLIFVMALLAIPQGDCFAEPVNASQDIVACEGKYKEQGTNVRLTLTEDKPGVFAVTGTLYLRNGTPCPIKGTYSKEGGKYELNGTAHHPGLPYELKVHGMITNLWTMQKIFLLSILDPKALIFYYISSEQLGIRRSDKGDILGLECLNSLPVSKPGSDNIKVLPVDGKDSSPAQNPDAGDVKPVKFSVELSAPKTQLEPAEQVVVVAKAEAGTPPYLFAWSIDGLAMPSRNVPTLPIIFAKLGKHFIVVTAKDSSVPPAEVVASINLFVGKTNDPDLVGRWEGTGTVLEFKSGMPEVDAQAQGKTVPFTLWIAPNGTGGLKMTGSGGPGFFCHPDEQTVRDGDHVRIEWDGPSNVPQTASATSTTKCSVDIVLTDGRLKGTTVMTNTTTIAMPGFPVQTGSSHVKTAIDVGRVSTTPSDI